jgi:hypothetical protein
MSTVENLHKNHTAPSRPTRAEASRINGAKSKGPITPEGKLKSSKNSCSHGLYAEQSVLPNEDPAHFAELLNSYVETYGPTDPVEQVIVGPIATMDWKFKRLIQLESACCADVIQDTHVLIASIEKFSKLQHTAERALTRAHKDLFEHRREKRLHDQYRDKREFDKTNPSHPPIAAHSLRAIPTPSVPKNAETNPTILNKNSENEPKEKLAGTNPSDLLIIAMPKIEETNPTDIPGQIKNSKNEPEKQFAETNPTNSNPRPTIDNPQETNPATQEQNIKNEPEKKSADTNPRNLPGSAKTKTLSQAEQILIGDLVEAQIKSLGYKPSEHEVEIMFEDCVTKLMAAYARVDAEEILKTKRPSGIRAPRTTSPFPSPKAAESKNAAYQLHASVPGTQMSFGRGGPSAASDPLAHKTINWRGKPLKNTHNPPGQKNNGRPLNKIQIQIFEPEFILSPEHS